MCQIEPKSPEFARARCVGNQRKWGGKCPIFSPSFLSFSLVYPYNRAIINCPLNRARKHMTKLTLNVEISWTDSKSGTTEAHELTAETDDQMAQKIVALWLERCKIKWNESERASLQEFVDGKTSTVGIGDDVRHELNAAYDLAAQADRYQTVVCNWSTIDQALVNSNDAEQELFIRIAQQHAWENGFGFQTIRDIQLPGFFLSEDGGETKEDSLDDKANTIFEAICEKVSA